MNNSNKSRIHTRLTVYGGLLALLPSVAFSTINPPNPQIAQPAWLIEDYRFVQQQGGDGDGDGVPESYNNIFTPPVSWSCSGCLNPKRIWRDWAAAGQDGSFWALSDLGFTMDISGGAWAYSDYDWSESRSVFDVVFQPVGYDSAISGWYLTRMQFIRNAE